MNLRFPPPVFSSDTCGWRIDLRSHIMFSPHAFDGEGVDASPFWKFTYKHEVAHWVRWQSSSIGMLLSTLQRARGLTAYQALCSLDVRSRTQIITDACNGVPIWTLESGYAPGIAGEDFALSGQFWLDQYISYQVLFDDSCLDGFRCPDESFSCAFADAWLACARFPSMRAHPGNHIAEKIVTGRIEPVAKFGYRLTTRSLFECASTLDELEIGEEVAEDISRDQLRMINYKLEDENYGGPWQVANQMCKDGTDAKVLRVAIHIALNPPLPFWDESVRTLRWSDLHPGARFVKVYEYIARNSKSIHEVFDMYSIEDAVGILIGIIVEGSGIPYAKMFGVEDAAILDVHPSVMQPVVGDVNHVIRTGLALRGRWREAPQMFVFPEIFGSFAFSDHEDLSSELYTLRLTKPPLMQFADGLRNTDLLDTFQNGNYCTSAFLRNSIESLITGSGLAGAGDYLPDTFPTRDYSERLPSILTSNLVKIDW